MAQLDETIDANQSGHITDHEALARKANDVFDVMDYGAVGDGVADDTVALDAAVVAADAAGRGTLYFPLGTYITTGLALTGTGVNIQGQGPTSILKGKSGITGAVLDLTGWVPVGSNLGTGFFRDFNIEGDSVADAGKTHYGLNSSAASGAAFDNIAISKTGGPGWYSTFQWGCTFKNITLARPVSADTNDVPYAFFRGWMNICTFENIGFRSQGGIDGTSVWLIEDDGTNETHDSTFIGCWFENCQLAENAAALDFAVSACKIEAPGFVDCDTSSDNQTGSCFMRFRAAPNGASTTTGGNYIWGHIPGDGKAARNIPYGVELLQDRNFVNGVRGYDGRNVHIATAVAWTSVVLGGRVTSTSLTIEGVVNDSTATNNTILDLSIGMIELGSKAKLERSRGADVGLVQIGDDITSGLVFGTETGGAQPKIRRTTAAGKDLFLDASEWHFRDENGAGESVTIRPIGIAGSTMIVRSTKTDRSAVEVIAIASQGATIPILEVTDNGGTQLFGVLVSGEVNIAGPLNHDGSTIGFYGATPATKPTITGARDDGTALADLLTELATLGLIIDSSTAS